MKKGESGEDFCCRLQKSLCTAFTNLPTIGMERFTSCPSATDPKATTDPCLYIRAHGLAILVLSVDNVLLTGMDMNAIEDSKKVLMIYLLQR